MDMVSPKEAAEILGITKSRIYEMIKDDTLKAFNLNAGREKNRSHLKIDREEIERFIQSCATNKEAPCQF